MAKIRLDDLVQHAAGVSRSKAQGLIQTGQVTTKGGERFTTAGQLVDEATEVVIQDGPPYVSRGGKKLEAALGHFDILVEDSIAIDAGASTGGFTDCLLQHGAAKVYAVDVGYGQLDWKLRQDDRVVVMERTNIRHIKPDDFDEAPGLFTADCSFISLKLVLPPLKSVLTMKSQGIVLIKPQFEAEKDQVGKGGVVRDDAIHQRVIEAVKLNAASVGFETVGVIQSPLLGPAGNKEFLAHLVSNEN
jgi:23S rRNA (cytidine1920-2'-O)/16S rRNA (cytidine1409-2'-O)-methyltransferase